LVTLCLYIRGNIFIFTHCWLLFFSMSDVQVYTDPLLVTLFQYIRGNSIILTFLSVLCQYIRHNILFWTTVVYSVLVYQRQPFYSNPLLVTPFQYLRGNSCFSCHAFFNIPDRTILSAPTVGYSVSVYKGQHFYPHTILVSLFQYIRGNSFS